MRKHALRFVAALVLVACTGDRAVNPSARKDLSSAYLTVSSARPAPGDVVTMTIRPGAGDAILGGFAARVILPSGTSYVADRGADGVRVVRVSADTVLIAAAEPTGFGTDALFAFDVRVDAPENLATARLEMTDASPATAESAASAAVEAAASTTLWGDITWDGNITTADAQAIVSASLSLAVSGAFQLPLGDANCDGNLSTADAQIVLAKIVGSNVSAFCVGTTATIVMMGEIRDAVAFTPLSGAKITLTTAGAEPGVALPRTATTASNGGYVFYNNIPDGTYSMAVTANGYTKGTVSSIVIDRTAGQVVEAALTPTTSSTPFGSISGRVLLGNGTPVVGAVVQLSGGIQTNGPFKATTSGLNGSYSFAGVAMTDAVKVPIQSFTITAKSTADEIGSTTGVTFAANEIKTNVDVTVAASSTVATSYFSEGFDSGIPSTWAATGLWSHRGTNAILNKAYPNQVKLAANDVSFGVVPLPMTGTGAAWAGSASTGNFIGTQMTGDGLLSGGTSADDTMGLLTSPQITIPAGAAHATLYFDAWFEIESVNPNAEGFDIMEVTVTDVAAAKTRSLTRLNPFEDPPLGNRAAIPFTSGGFNRNPVWRPVYFNLDAYRGKVITLGFCFRTVDALYNGFRGWLIDNVRVSDEVGAGTTTSMMAGDGSVGAGRPSRGSHSGDMAGGLTTSCSGDVETIPVASVTVAPKTTSLKITESVQLFATPFDSGGGGLAGQFVSWSSSNSNVASVSSTGLVTGKGTGTATIRVFVEGKTDSATVTVGLPTSTMKIHAGNQQTVLANQPVPILPSVKVVNASGQPVAGATVVFAVGSGGGSVTVGTQTTNANGVATVGSWTLGVTPGPNTLTVSSSAVTNGPLTFTATGASTGLNLTIENLTISQATQNSANDVPLVAGRPALIRVFVKASQANTAKPSVRVSFFKGGSVVKTYTIASTSTAVPTSVTDASLATSWNASIPATDIETGLFVLAEVVPDSTVTETVTTDNSYPKSGNALALDVRSMPVFNVTFVPVTQPGGVVANINDSTKDAFIDFARRIYPIAATDAVVHAPFSYGTTLSNGYDASWTNLLLQIKALRVAELPAPGTSRHYYGVIHPTYVSGATGLAYLGDPAAVGTDMTTTVTGTNSDQRAVTAAHEWGHNFNRRHVDCGSPPNVDPAYPYTTTQMGVHGYDVFKNAFLGATTKTDIMGYCAAPWISDYTYKAVLEYRASTGQGVVFQASGATRGLLVWGQIGPDGIKLEPSFEVTARPSLPSSAGPNSVQALDASGAPIFNLSFQGDEVDHLPGVRHFAYVVPLPANVAAPSALRLRANGREVLTRATAVAGGATTSSASAPSISRVAGRSRLQWNAAEYPMAMVRDATTGQILTFARGGSADIVTRGADVEVFLSDGVTSTRRAMRVQQP